MPNDCSYLVGSDNATVELVRSVLQIFVKLLQFLLTGFTGELIPFIYLESSINLAALLGDLRFDTVNFITHIDAIGYGAVMVIFHHQILIKETQGLFRWCCRQSDDEAIEVFQYLPPQMVDGAVAFVGNNKIELFDGDFRVINDLFYFVGARQSIETGQFLPRMGQVPAARSASSKAVEWW